MSAWSDAVAALSGLVGWWRLGETSGTNADNAEGNAAKDGTYTGTYTLNQGSLTSLVDADPSFSVAGAGYVTIADHSDFSLTTTSKLTIGFWHNPSAANNTVIIGKGTASNYEWAVYRSTSSYYALVWQSAGGTRATVNNAPTGPFPDGSRNFVVLTLDDTGSDAAQLYVNGLTGAAITGWTGSSTNGTSPVDIGRRPDNTAAHTGVVDEVFITNTAMTQAEVIALMRTAQPVVIPRGTGARNTGSESSYAITPATNFSGVSGAMAVLAVAYDNSGTNGADPYSSIADTNTNTWTSRQNSLNDPGAASAGIAGRIFTTSMDGGALDTGDTVTVTFGSTTVARSYALWEVIPQTGYTIAYGTGAVETSATASPTITTGSIAAGDVVIGAIGREGNDSATADTDTTNGMWSGQQASGIGTTTSGNQISSQYKVALASGTQTYNPTFGASRDNVEMWLSVVATSLVRSASIVATGGGVSTVSQATTRTRTQAATGGGVTTASATTIRGTSVTATGGGTATASVAKIGRASAVATGAGVATTSATTTRTRSDVATGAGVTTVAQSTVRTSAHLGTGGGVATVAQSTSRSMSVEATGAGVATIAGSKRAALSLAATGAGIADADTTTIRAASVAATGGGVATVDGEPVSDDLRSASIVTTGGGVAAVMASKLAYVSIGATGGGTIPIDAETWRLASVLVTGGGVATVDGGRPPFDWAHATSTVTLSAMAAGRVTVTDAVPSTVTVSSPAAATVAADRPDAATVSISDPGSGVVTI